MKYIINLTNDRLLPRRMTLFPGPNLVVNEETLDWDEVKELLAEGKIKIIDSEPDESDSSES